MNKKENLLSILRTKLNWPFGEPVLKPDFSPSCQDGNLTLPAPPGPESAAGHLLALEALHGIPFIQVSVTKPVAGVNHVCFLSGFLFHVTFTAAGKGEVALILRSRKEALKIANTVNVQRAAHRANLLHLRQQFAWPFGAELCGFGLSLHSRENRTKILPAALVPADALKNIGLDFTTTELQRGNALGVKFDAQVDPDGGVFITLRGRSRRKLPKEQRTLNRACAL